LGESREKMANAGDALASKTQEIRTLREDRLG